jgi:hypothetical protein
MKLNSEEKIHPVTFRVFYRENCCCLDLKSQPTF